MKIVSAAPARASYHHGDLRHALLQAALKLIAEKGVVGFSLREAARAVGVSAGAAYRHFEDRSDLLAALALDGMGRLAKEMEQALARAPGAPGTPARAAAELVALGEAYVEFAVANPSHFRVMFGPWCDHPEMGEIPPEALPGGRDPYQLLLDTLDGLVRTGAISPAARQGAEIAAWSSVHGLASLLVEGSVELTATERAQAYGVLVRVLLLGLGAKPALLAPAARPAVRRPTRWGHYTPPADRARPAGLPDVDPRREKACRSGGAPQSPSAPAASNAAARTRTRPR